MSQTNDGSRTSQLGSIAVPSTQLSLSRVVLGTMTFGLQVEERDADAILDRCAEAGITSLDTANVYTGGVTEEMLGRLLDRNGRREHFTVATKIGGTPSPDAPDLPPLSAKAIRASVEGSLRRLRTDRVDVCYLHQPDRSTPILETLEAVGELVDEGRIDVLGVSNFSAWQISELAWAARTHSLPEPRLSQPIYNLLARRLEEEYAEYSRATGLVNIIYNPLAGGLLTGKYRAPNSLAAQGRFGDTALGAVYRDRYWTEPLRNAVGRLDAVASDAGLSLIELAFRWLLGREVVGAVLLGASSLKQLEENLVAMSGVPLDEHTSAECDAIWAGLRGAAPVYNR